MPAQPNSEPQVSVLTAAYEPDEAHLLDAYRSLDEQDVDWQWVIQVDGPAAAIEAIPRDIQADERVAVAANGERLGVAATRNLGLLRCDYELIQNLDADDMFYPGAIRGLAETITTKGVAFAFGESHLLYPDGTSQHWQPAPWGSGIIEPRVITDTWLATGRHHVSLSATLWKTAYIHAHGGWGALRGMQDVYMMLAIADESQAAYVATPTTKYRVHEKQATAQPELRGVREVQHRQLIAARIAARRMLNGSFVSMPPAYVQPNDQKSVALPFSMEIT